MIAALAISAVAVLVGSGLGILTRARSPWLVPVRTFAVMAVTSAVIVQLLPEAIAAAGPGALYAFAAALLVPAVLAAVRAHDHDAASRRMTAHQWGHELGFIGFLAHQLIECLALGTYAGAEHAEHDHLGLFVAIAAHTLPLTAIFVTEAVTHYGKPRAIRRAALVLAATVAGFLLGGVLDESVLGLGQWLSAGLAGFLIHVVLHPSAEATPRSRTVATLELVMAGLGLGLPLLATHGHGPVSTLQADLLTALAALALATAPMLLVGLALAAGLATLPWVAPPWRGVLAGDPFRPETFTLTLRFFGLRFALVRLAAAIAVAYVLAAFVRPTHPLAQDRPEPSPPALSFHAWLRRFDALLSSTAPWIVLGLVVAAFVQVLVPPNGLDALARTGLDVAAAVLLSIPAAVCPAAATPLLAVLLGKGLSPGAVLVGLLLGPATRVHGSPARAGTVLAVLGLGLLLGYGINAWPERLAVLSVVPSHSMLALAALAVLLVGLTSQLFRFGLGPWFAVVLGEHDHAGHGDGHVASSDAAAEPRREPSNHG